MIYELVGLPGTGKSTALSNSKKHINEECYVLLTEDYYKLLKSNKCLVVFHALKFFACHLLFLLEIVIFFKRNLRDYNYDSNRLYSFIRYICYFYYLKKCCKNKIVIDQGIIQFFISVTFNIEGAVFPYVEREELTHILNSLVEIFDLKIIFWESDLRLAAHYASLRNGDCFIDNLDEESIYKFYIRKVEDYNLLWEILNKVSFKCSSYKDISTYINV